jgi:NAD(P)-dependent dehydrogenase (short-subunit alcohol dehydrogenase family)
MGQQPVALITGASSGIGQASAERLAANGFLVIGTSRSPDARSDRSYTMLPLDVREDASVDAALQAVHSQLGRIDLLVNNAGYAQAGAIEENSIADAQAQFETNLFGVMRMTNAVVPLMRRQGGGRIINISSVLGQLAFPYIGLYAASKFALEGFTEALREELRPFAIHVSLIEPGFVKTSFAGQPPRQPIEDYAAVRQAALQFTRAGIAGGIQPDMVARAILAAAIAPHPRLRYQVGRTAHVLTALKHLLTDPAFERVRRRLVPIDI